jgi:beta-glucanase (GH16 family)
MASWGAGRLSAQLGTICVAAIALSGAVQATVAEASPPAGYSLTWSDEFNGPAGSQANPAKWTYDLGNGASNFGNDEQETYTNSYANSHIVSDPNATDGLALQIIALNTNGNITSARLKSQGLHVVKYGYIEARIEAFNSTGNQGVWPAWWMMGEDKPSVEWPNCGEIDVMEQWNGSNQNHMSIHGQNMTGSSLSTNGPANCHINQYHTYGLLWTPTTMTYYVDGVQEASYTRASSPAWPFNQPFFYLLNIAVGGSGSFIGSWNSATTWPQTMNVDYIREYQPVSGTVIDTVTATAPANVTFTGTAAASPASVSTNSPVTITETAEDTGAAATGAIVDCEVYNSAGTQVFQKYTTDQTFRAGQSQKYTYTWTPTTAGTYTVWVGVFSANWATNYVFNANAATVTAH